MLKWDILNIFNLFPLPLFLLQKEVAKLIQITNCLTLVNSVFTKKISPPINVQGRALSASGRAAETLVLSSEHPSKIPQTTTHTLPPPFRLYPSSSSPDALSALIVPQCPFLHCAFYSCLLSLVFWAWVSPWPACLHGYTRSPPQVKAASITRLGKVSFSKFPMFCRLIRKLVQHRCCTASSMLGFCFDSQKTSSQILPFYHYFPLYS